MNLVQTFSTRLSSKYNNIYFVYVLVIVILTIFTKLLQALLTEINKSKLKYQNY